MLSLVSYQANIFNKQIRDNLDLKTWLDFYKLMNDPWLAISDRTKQFNFPIRTHIPDNFLVPTFKESNLTFSECALIRAQEIISHQECNDLPIHILYSGGIDSSVVLSSFIELLGVNEASRRIKIQMNQSSIDENPEMWYKFIRPHFSLIDSNYTYNDRDYGNWIYVTGELNDQLFGAEIQQVYEKFTGINSLNEKINLEKLVKFFTECRKMDKKSASVWAAMLIDNMSTCPNHNNSMWDLFWWYNFTWKWIYVYFRFFLFFRNQHSIDGKWMENNYFPFFDTPKFQLWSMNSKEDKHHSDWNSYKVTAKEFVCKTHGSADYMKKVKRRSLPLLIHSKPKVNAIDKNFNILEQVNFNDVYNLNNSIVQYEKNL
jgi:hypothetical protein